MLNLFSAETKFGANEIIIIVLVVALVLMLVVMPMFTNKKRQQAVSQLHGALKPGDKIMTIGGIIGIVKEINQTSPVDKELVIETGVGDNKTTMVIDIKALYQVVPPQSGAPVFEAANNNSNVDVYDNTAKNTAEEEVTDSEVVEADEPAVNEEAATSNEEEVVEVVSKPKTASPKSAAAKPTSTKKPISKK